MQEETTNRKKKCDLRKPKCDNCSHLGLECAGYKQRVLWEDDPVRHGIKRRGPRKSQQRRSEFTSAISHAHKSCIDEIYASVEGSTCDRNYLARTLTTEPQHEDFHTLFDTLETDLPYSVSSPDTFESFTISVPSRIETSCTTDLPVVVAPPKLFKSPNNNVLSPVEHLLWDYYVNVFSRSYPTCSDANNPFLSCLIPIAFQYPPVRQILLALAALQAKHVFYGTIEQEMHRLRRNALEACQNVSQSASGSQLLAGDTQFPNTNTHFGFSGAMLLLGRSEKLFLVTIAALMILFAKLSGAPYESIRSHMDFAREYFVFEETFGSDLKSISQTPLYVFLHSLVSYNEMLVRLVMRKPLLETGKMPLRVQPSSDQSTRPQKTFLTLLSRTIEMVEEVSFAEFDEWDGNLDFIPSYSMNSGRSDSSPLPQPMNEYPDLDEDFTIQEIYRAAGRIYYLQQVRDRWSGPYASTTVGVPPRAAQNQIDTLASHAMDLLRTLAENTRYNTALLLPLGIIGPELRSSSNRAFLLSKLDSLHQTLYFDHYSAFSRDLILSWAKVDAEERPNYPLSSQNWLRNRSVLLIG
ncbi:uncharacterized protein A1O9_07449 [Exophiala aquamarina CBS 119918]|uniref:Zn(2)-C6 fungal-type domain-containing protein n=1 Tax=Exophiala aquamarina CBS 119918 TaxID=1182545 RepID=A0A072P6Y7_9EURO|nr:uncharacterized protein A1O9_07449 [Exophiala aquamarina CBS 119918]KEF55869.1 hypothetical protein A1O9_07449 [Exophiala aquamarina CBS 119918]